MRIKEWLLEVLLLNIWEQWFQMVEKLLECDKGWLEIYMEVSNSKFVVFESQQNVKISNIL